MVIVKIVLLALVGLYLIRLVVGHLLTWYYFDHYDRFCRATEHKPEVSIIKPVRGVDHRALDNFRSFCNQEYRNHYEIIFCVENGEDPVVPVIEQLMEEYPEKDIRLVFSAPEGKRSAGKVRNMVVGLAESKGEVIIFSDSDVHVSPRFLRDVVACMDNTHIGLAFSVPAYEGAENCAAAMLSVAVNTVVVSLTPLCLIGGYDRAIGMTMVTRRDVLDEIGGLEQFEGELADDVALATAIHEKGYGIHLLSEPARVYHIRDTFPKVWRHALRWLVTIRLYSPITVYLAALVDIPLVWAIAYLIISIVHNTGVLIGLLLIAGVIAARLISFAVINAKFVQDGGFWRFIWVAPLLDLLKAPLLVYCFMTNEIVWRGRRVYVNSDRTLTYLHNRPG